MIILCLSNFGLLIVTIILQSVPKPCSKHDGPEVKLWTTAHPGILEFGQSLIFYMLLY